MTTAPPGDVTDIGTGALRRPLRETGELSGPVPNQAMEVEE